MTVDVEFVWRYRFAHETGDEANATSLRSFCETILGEGNVHEIAFKDPISAEALAERKQFLVNLTRSNDAELAWLATVKAFDGPPLANKRIRRRLDPLRSIWKYRYAHDRQDTFRCRRLREDWAAQRGEDNLHEIAYRKPISVEEVAERKQELIKILRRIESELAWLETRTV
ncbi:MAG TPA: hypothetical protein VGP63_10390 [Planctomycetaceae bacterium]|jgi:hypothetical protein|nr:hypothetical protein [Planctomycetaceae bacterium]